MSICVLHDDWTPSRMVELVRYEFRARNVVFDVSGTLASQDLTTIRRGAVETLEALHKQGTDIYLWASEGDTYCKEAAAEMGVESAIAGYFTKPSVNTEVDDSAISSALGFTPDVLVDDHTMPNLKRTDFIHVTVCRNKI